MLGSELRSVKHQEFYFMILDSIYPEVLVNSVSRVIEQMIDLTSKQTD